MAGVNSRSHTVDRNRAIVGGPCASHGFYKAWGGRWRSAPQLMLRSEALAQKRVHHGARGLPLAIVVGFSLSTTAVAAGDRLTLSGKWQASPMSLQRAIGEWGPSCGPQPGIPGGGGGPVTVTQSDTELTIVGSGVNYSTAACWEKHSSLSRTHHSGGSRAWSNVCESGGDTSNHVSIRTTISATDTSIHFDETGQYQFRVDGHSCTASTRRTQHFTLLERAETASAQSVEARGDTDCSSPGTPERLEVSPTNALVRPGQELQFAGKLRDSAGCALPHPISWRIHPEVDGVTVSEDGLVTVRESVDVESLTLTASASGLSRQAVLRVASRGRYEALLDERRDALYGSDGATENSTGSSSAMSTAVAVAEDRATSRKHWFVALVGVLAAGLAALGTVFVRQGRTKSSAMHPSGQVAANTPGTHKVCPTCGSIYGDRAEFCGKDGTRLTSA